MEKPIQNWQEILKEYRNSYPGKQFLTIRLKEGQYSWPTKFTKINLFNRTWLLWPRTEEDMPGIIIPSLKEDKNTLAKMVMRFLSALSWVHNTGIEHEGFWTLGNGINSCRRSENDKKFISYHVHEFLIDEYDYLPLPEDEKAQLALAIYREAQSLNNDIYKFLSFFKILNIKHNGKQQIEWINNNIDKITNHIAQDTIRDLKANQQNVGDYLYTAGRCAVAHANGNPIVNPDNPEDIRRLNQDLPAIKALAEFMIEEEFGIKGSQTIWREHLYELNGFKEIIGEELLGLFLEDYEFNKDCDNIFALIENKLPRISVRLRNEDEQPFEDLVPIVAGKNDKTLILSCQSEKVPLEVLIGLDFGEERLVFYPLDGFNVYDNGTAESAKHAAQSNRFIGRLFANGTFEVWETGGKLLGRKDPYIPVNIMPDKTYENYFNRAKSFDEIYEKRYLKVYSPNPSGPNKNRLLSSTYLKRKYTILF